mgnify:CR=1 FL=1
MSIKDLPDLLAYGELKEMYGTTDGSVSISNGLAARVFTEFSQLRDEVDLLHTFLGSGQSCPLLSSFEALFPQYKGEQPMSDEQRYQEQPYTEQDVIQAKVAESVTKQWENLDNNGIVESIMYADEDKLSTLVDLMRDLESDGSRIADTLGHIINDHFVSNAEEYI